jgi:hypothetical protein
LNVGEEGVSFECATLNAKNQEEEAHIEFLDSEIFKNGLRLATVAQPAIAPLTAMATNITKMLAAGNREVAVQNFRMGLDFSNGPGGARLAEGLYIAIQIPQEKTVLWKCKVSMCSGLSGSIWLTTIRNDLIKGLVNVFPNSLLCQTQSQPVGASSRRRSLVDCITVMLARRIGTKPHRIVTI